MDWALEYALEYDAPYSASRYDRYEASRYETETYSPARYEEGRGMETYEDAQDDAEEGGRDGLSRRLRQRAVQRMATSALLWGASFHRPLTAWAKKAVEYTFKTRAGRRLLRQSVIVSGGVAGAALVAAVASLVAQRKAGPPPTGVLQGSPLSPLLANIYLHPFDVAMQKQRFHLARFADDWVVCCPSQEQAEGAHNEAIRALARLRLKVNPAKTRIVSPKEPLEWLGVVIK